MSLDRRTFLKTAAAAATLSAAGAVTVSAQSYYPGLEWGYDAGQALGGWVGEEVNDLFSDDEDMSGYTGGDALKLTIEEKALTLAITNEQVLSNLENTAEFADNAALPKGMAAVVEAYNDEDNDQDAVQTAMEDEIDAYYADVERDVLTAYENTLTQMKAWYDALENHEDTDPNDILGHSKDQSGDGYSHEGYDEGVQMVFGQSEYADQYVVAEKDVTLHDGSTETVMWFHFDQPSSGTEEHLAPQEGFKDTDFLTPIVMFSQYDPSAEEDDAVQNDAVQVLQTLRFWDLFDAIDESRDRVYSNLSSFVTDVFDHYDRGDVDLEEFVDPITAHTELRAEDDPDAYAGSAAALIGIPRNEEPMTLHFEESDTETEGSIYSTDSPDGGFEVGTTYDPDDLDYPVFARVQVTEDDEQTTDFIEVDEQFSISEATDPDGNDLESVEMEDGPTYDPSDIESLQDQLDQVHEEQLRLQEQAQESGGPIFEGFDPLGNAKHAAVALIAASLGVAALGNSGGSGGSGY